MRIASKKINIKKSKLENEKQRNYSCSKLYRKRQKKNYELLDLKNVTDNNEF